MLHTLYTNQRLRGSAEGFTARPTKLSCCSHREAIVHLLVRIRGVGVCQLDAKSRRRGLGAAQTAERKGRPNIVVRCQFEQRCRGKRVREREPNGESTKAHGSTWLAGD